VKAKAEEGGLNKSGAKEKKEAQDNRKSHREVNRSKEAEE